jgi:hypothetical protein
MRITVVEPAPMIVGRGTTVRVNNRGVNELGFDIQDDRSGLFATGSFTFDLTSVSSPPKYTCMQTSWLPILEY